MPPTSHEELQLTLVVGAVVLAVCVAIALTSGWTLLRSRRRKR